MGVRVEDGDADEDDAEEGARYGSVEAGVEK
jgi:hypothetical protein